MLPYDIPDVDEMLDHRKALYAARISPSRTVQTRNTFETMSSFCPVSFAMNGTIRFRFTPALEITP